MRYLYIFNVMIILGLLILSTGCDKDSIGPQNEAGSIKISIKNSAKESLTNTLAKINNQITITSAKIVIAEIEFESVEEDSFDFKLHEPFVQDLMLDTNAHVIQSVQLPFGTYKESEIEIDQLISSHGNVFTQNPDLQNRSVFVEGYLNNDTTESFAFFSDLEEEQEMEFDQPLVLDENSPSTNIVLHMDVNTWFVDSNGNLLDPRNPAYQSQIEENIKNSIDVFEDEDDDGEDDDG